MSALSQEQKDIIEIKGNLQRLENHFKTYKNDVIDIKDSLKEVRQLLGGSELNGRKGFINLMDEIEKRVDGFNTDLIAIKKDIDNTKYWGRTATAIFVALFAYFFRSHSN